MADDNSTTFKNSWHLDKRVPVAFILAILGQTGAFLWWAASINERVASLEKSNSVAIISAPIQADRLTRVESKMESVQRDLTEIKADVKSLIRREPPNAQR